jgi:putative salt-induced outer membrane protein YdiY
VRHRARGGPSRPCRSEYKYLLTFEAGIDTAITKHLSLRVVFQDMYASQPAPGKKQNDMRLLAGASYKF